MRQQCMADNSQLRRSIADTLQLRQQYRADNWQCRRSTADTFQLKRQCMAANWQLRRSIAALLPNAQLASMVDQIHRRRQGVMSLLDGIARVERIGRQPGKSRRFWIRLGRTSAWWDNCLLGIAVPEEGTV